MSEITQLIPIDAAFFALDAGDVAGLLLQYFHSLEHGEQRRQMKASVLTNELVRSPFERRYDVTGVFIEGWQWLLNFGFLIPRPQGSPDEFAFSRLGQMTKNRQALQAFRERNRFPRELLHTAVAEKAWPLYLRGDLDTAVFQAFKEVEVAVRLAGAYGDTDFGKDLMRKAFRPTTEVPPGPLSDGGEPEGEQKSLQELFAGSYGRARNPTAYRHGVLNDPTEAFEMLVIASHLLRVVDRRRPSPP